jgi:hypothetical protein
MKTAVTMLGEAFRQWQKDWDSYDKGIGDKPKSYDEFIIPFIELEKEQIIDAHFNGMDKLATSLSEFLPIKHTMSVIKEIKNGGELHEDGEQYYNETYNQN